MNNKSLIAITGASSGIGKATAEIFLEAGFPVLVMARREEKLKEIKGKKLITAKVDVTNIEQIISAIKKAESLYGPVDLIVNNAGIMPLEKYASQKLSDKYQMINVNLIGVINGIDAVLPNMIKRQHGTIINISSIAGRYVYDNHAVYSATKFAVNALTEAVRKETVGKNIRFTLIEPGIVNTNLLNLTENKAILDQYNDWKTNINGGLKALDIAKVIFNVYNLPQDVNLKEILLTHTLQSG